jgi:hypothetical protein
MQSIVIDVLHKCTPWLPLEGWIILGSEDEGVNSITAYIRKNLRKNCGKPEEKDGRAHSDVDLDHPLKCGVGITRNGMF